MGTFSLLLSAFGGGMLLGALYCGLLWHGVRRLAQRRRATHALLAGSAIRIALVIGGLAVLTGWRAFETAAALAGFVVVRIGASLWVSSRGRRDGARTSLS